MQRPLRRLMLPILQIRVTQSEVSLITKGAHFLIARIELPQFIQNARRAVHVAAAHHRNSEVELRIVRPCVALRPVTEDSDRLRVIGIVDVKLRLQHVALRFEQLGQFTFNVVQRVLRFLEVAPLMPDLGEEEPRAVTNLGLDIPGEQALENFRSPHVMSVGQVQSAQ